MNICNPNLWEAEAGGFLNLRTAWSAERPRTIRATQRNSLKLKKKKKLPPVGV
ncbi:rCG51434 [Rattus norvegicus]|uniref:RCG51434 n=1 Tax=Rattus norvegicus TaxID=10116 RepID=A6IZ76_RAT|nr:rCG51434 [Rattus norvegicus]